MELPNLFGLHIQASCVETLAEAYIGNFLAIENSCNRLAGFDPKGGDRNPSTSISLLAISGNLLSCSTKLPQSFPNAYSLSFRFIL